MTGYVSELTEVIYILYAQKSLRELIVSAIILLKNLKFGKYWGRCHQLEVMSNVETVYASYGIQQDYIDE